MSNFWKGKNVLITGASSGIGAALSEAICRKGGNVGLMARRIEQLKEIEGKCSQYNTKTLSLPCDVSNKTDIDKSFAEFIKEFGMIDILIANAGIGGNNDQTRQIDAAAVKKVIDINLIGSINIVSAVLPQMIEQKSGQLVAVSSLAGVRGLPGSAAYSASKAGMTAFFESIRLDMLGKGIDVTIILPGFIKTPLTSGRSNKMPFLMELEDSIPYFLDPIEKRKRFASFPAPLSWLVRAGKIFPGWLYDRVAGRARFRE